MRKRNWKTIIKPFAVLAIILSLTHAAGAQDTVRVQALSKYLLKETRVIFPDGQTGKVILEGKNLRWTGNPALGALDSERNAVSFQGSLRVEGQDFGSKAFSGRLTVSVRDGNLFFVAEIPLESYVAAVLASEMPATAPLEALKAQAVLVRSYAQTQRGRHEKEGFDFCDLTHCQVYGGEGYTPESVARAVQATRGQILSFRGRPAEIVFHSTCGGHTSANQRVFGGRSLSYLQGVGDEGFCDTSAHVTWETEIPVDLLEKALARDPGLNFQGPLKEIVAADREPEGRWFSVELIGERRVVIPMEKFLSLVGREIGWQRLKSGWFEVMIKGGSARFIGHGLGHGVGLCQEGAIGMARAGKSYQEILRHYFPGTSLESFRD